MTIPSRPAPPPPNALNNNNRNQISRASPNNTANQVVSRYTPTTNWDDKPFENNGYMPITQNKKNPPPRPPPPRPAMPILKKPGSQHSVNLLSNLFGAKRSRTPPAKLNYQVNGKVIPPKIPPPFSKNGHTSSLLQSRTTNESQLIDLDSPPSSPTLTQKSSSDCVSVSSFSSDSNYSSPNNGNISQAESGFEDDFNLDPCIQNNKDPWEPNDPFSSALDKSSLKPQIAQKPMNIGATSFYMYTSEIQKDLDNPLCNGKSLITPAPPITAPTIIRPIIPTKPSAIGNYHFKTKQINKKVTEVVKVESIESDSPPSPPMPRCPPPPPPPEFFDGDGESFGICLYDFDGTQVEDLSLKENEKVYLIREVDSDWFFGRNKRGCEGIFPISYIDVKIPLQKKEDEGKLMETNKCEKIIPKIIEPVWSVPERGFFIRALYNFTAEVDDDLSLQENSMVEVLYKINSEWLFGRIGNRTGQFPANFIEYQPQSLPIKP